MRFFCHTASRHPLSRMLTPRTFSLLSLGCLAVSSLSQNHNGLLSSGGRAEALTLSDHEAVQIIVNSDQDDVITPDGELTLREAIAIANGDLTLAALSVEEQAQIFPRSETGTLITFDLPSGQPIIELKTPLPPILQSDVILDGMSVDATNPPVPGISITPAPEAQTEEHTSIHRGFTVAADRVTIQGFHLYGFHRNVRKTHLFPSAAITIANPDAPFLRREDTTTDTPGPTEIIIQDNWIGQSTSLTPSTESDFGVWIYKGSNLKLLRNKITQHLGSAIISSIHAKDTVIQGNEISGNGFQGTANAIHLEGNVDQVLIQENQITNNAGSGIYLFKPQGSIVVQDNHITHNGRSRSRAAIVLMGNDHLVQGNTIEHQPGPGVVVASYPQSDRNLILNNRFVNLQGLSIDLLSRFHTQSPDYHLGDGPNLARNSKLRKHDTANRAIDAPRFLSSIFYLFDGKVALDGVADPDTTVTLYQVYDSAFANEEIQLRGELSCPIAETTADADGKFSVELSDIQDGSRFSAIATHPDYGTSEPAMNVEVRSIASSGLGLKRKGGVAQNCPAT